MFERYTEKARRAVFFARYEASQYGSQFIDCEHLLLGLLRENGLPSKGVHGEWFRSQIEKNITRGETIPMSVEMPPTEDCKQALKFAEEESKGLKSAVVGPEHLLIGVSRVENCLAARLLRERGVTLGELRKECATREARADAARKAAQAHAATDSAESSKEVLQSFLDALRSEGASARFTGFFTGDPRLIDAKGRVWTGQEMEAQSEEIFAAYARKRASYRIEDARIVSPSFLHATVLWDLPGSGDAAWTQQRMSITILQDTLADWEICFLQVTPVIHD